MFWLLGFILPFAAVAAPPCQGGSPTYQRKEFRELIDPSDSSRLLPEGQAYIDGCLCLMNAPGSSAPDASIWVYQSYNIQDDFSKAHFDAMFPYHEAAFLPWHRLFLASMEKAMRDCTGNPDVYIPYWDNSLDSQAPERSLLWRFFGGDGNPDADQGNGPLQVPGEEEFEPPTHFGYCVSDGPFADIRLFYSRRGNAQLISEPDCLRRQLGTDLGEDTTISSPELVDMICREKDYSILNAGLEVQYHGLVHVYVGGDMADPTSAANDPIFYMHHANVDRLWSEWQGWYSDVAETYSGTRMDQDGSNTRQATVEDPLDISVSTLHDLYGTHLVNEMFKTTDWCYDYSYSVTPHRGTVADAESDADLSQGSSTNPETPDSSDRVDSFNVRPPNSFSPQNLRAFFNFNPSTVHTWESIATDYARYINRVNGYVSDAALVNQGSVGTWTKVDRAGFERREIVQGMLCNQFKKAAGLPSSLRCLFDPSLSGCDEEGIQSTITGTESTGTVDGPGGNVDTGNEDEKPTKNEEEKKPDSKHEEMEEKKPKYKKKVEKPKYRKNAKKPKYKEVEKKRKSAKYQRKKYQSDRRQYRQQRRRERRLKRQKRRREYRLKRQQNY